MSQSPVGSSLAAPNHYFVPRENLVNYVEAIGSGYSPCICDQPLYPPFWPSQRCPSLHLSRPSSLPYGESNSAKKKGWPQPAVIGRGQPNPSAPRPRKLLSGLPFSLFYYFVNRRRKNVTYSGTINPLTSAASLAATRRLRSTRRSYRSIYLYIDI